MKKPKIINSVLFSSIIFFISFTTSKAQIGIGVKGGLNLSKLTHVSDTDDNPSNITNRTKMGETYGLIFNFRANDLFSLQPELLYSSQGTKLSTSPFGNEISWIYTWNYAQLPILAKLSFGSEKLRFFTYAGPYLGYFLSAKLKLSGFGDDLITKDDFSDPNANRNVNRVDFGFAAGLGISFNIFSKGVIFVESRYNYGFLDTHKRLVTTEPDNSPVINRVLNFSAGYILYFGDK